MTITDSNGHQHSVAGEGLGTYGAVAGSLGIASFLGLNAGNVFGGWGRNGYNCGNGCGDQALVTKAELNYVQTIGAKDSEIALLKSENNTEKKMVEVYNSLLAIINKNKEEQAAINAQQSVYNCSANSAIAVLQSQTAQLMGLTKTIIPITNVCPEPMPAKNSWTAPTATT